jgi:transcriptional regulator with XRE-family HTH domain
MSPFSRFLHELRMSRNIRQSELAALMGYEQSYISALEIGLKGPPTSDFLLRLIRVLSLSEKEQKQLNSVAEASQRKLVIDPDTPEDVYWLLKDLRNQVASLTPIQIRMMRDVLQFCIASGEVKQEPVRRLKRRDKQEAEM